MALADSCGIPNEVLAALSQLDVKKLGTPLWRLGSSKNGYSLKLFWNTRRNEDIPNNAHQRTYSSQRRQRSQKRLQTFLERKRAESKCSGVGNAASSAHDTNRAISPVEVTLTTDLEPVRCDSSIGSAPSTKEPTSLYQSADTPSSPVLCVAMSPTLPDIKPQQLGPTNSLEANACDRVTYLPPIETPPQLVQNSADPDPGIVEVLKGAEDVRYEPRGDIPGVGYKKNGSKEWIPVTVSSQDMNGEYNMAYLNKCRRVQFLWSREGSPIFSIRRGNRQFPTPIAQRTRSRLKV